MNPVSPQSLDRHSEPLRLRSGQAPAKNLDPSPRRDGAQDDVASKLIFEKHSRNDASWLPDLPEDEEKILNASLSHSK